MSGNAADVDLAASSNDNFCAADQPEVGQTSQHEGVSRYKCDGRTDKHRFAVIRTRSVKDRPYASQWAGLFPANGTRSHSIIQSRGCASGYVNGHTGDTFRRV